MFKAGAIVGDLRLDMSRWSKNVTRGLADVRALKTNLGGMQGSLRGVTAQILQANSGIGRFADSLKASAGAARGLITAIGAVGVAAVGKQFLNAASEAEKMRVVFSKTLGSIEEGNKLFAANAKYAASVALTFEDVMHASVGLSAVLKGGREQIEQWIPLWGDLAAYVKNLGISAEETTAQLLRMMGGGAAAADLFREKGVLQMLGFIPGEQYSPAETAQMLVDAWMEAGSKFRGMATDMAKTWTGQLSMMADKWFLFRLAIMDKGPFETLKNAIKSVNEFFDAHFQKIVGLTVQYGGIALKIAAGAAAFVSLKIAAALGAFALGSVLSALNSVVILFPTLLAHIATTQIAFASLHLAGAGAFLGIAAMAATLTASIIVIAASVISLYGTLTNSDDITNIKKLWRDIKTEIEAVGDAIGGVIRKLQEFASFTPNKLFGEWAKGLVGKDSWLSKTPNQIGNDAAEALWNRVKGWWGKKVEPPMTDWFGGLAPKEKQYDPKMGNPLMAGRENYQAQLQEMLEWGKGLMSGMMDSVMGSGAVALDDWKLNLETMLKDIGNAAKKGSDEAAKALDKLRQHGRAVYLALNPVAGAMAEITNKITSLQAAGLLTDETRNMLGTALWREISELGPASIQAIIAKVQALDPAIAAATEQARQLAMAVKAEEIIVAAQPDLTAFNVIRHQIEAVKAAGRLDAETTSILAMDYWRQFGSMTVAELDTLLARLEQLGDTGRRVAIEMREAMMTAGALEPIDIEQASGIVATFEGIQQAVSRVSQEFVQLGQHIGSTVLQKIGETVGAIMTTITSYAAMGAAAKAAGAAAAWAWTHILGPIYLVIAAINTVISLFGAFGKKGKEEITGIKKLFKELEQQVSQWVDRFADHWVEFLETGKFQFKEFIDSMLKDLARLTAKLAMQEIVSGLFGVSFNAKGNVFDKSGNVAKFAKGGLITQPTFFPMPRGMLGLAGEGVKDEVIAPVIHMPDGEIGVRSAPSAVSLNLGVQIIDQTDQRHKFDVRERRGSDGTRNLQITIRNTIESLAGEGGLDRTWKYMNARAFT